MNNEDAEEIRDELREIRRLLICLTIEVASIKLLVAAGGKPIDTPVDDSVKQVGDVAQRTPDRLAAYGAERYNTPR